MIFLYLFEISIILLWLIIIITQIIIPIIKGTKLFPYFSKSKGKLLNELTKIKDEEEDEKLKLQILKETQKLEELKKEEK